MNRDDRFKFYEKLYFYESDRREKISARLSISFAAIIANVGLLSFMLNSDRDAPACPMQLLFWLLFSAAIVALLAGSWFFRKAWYGTTDEHLPSAREMEAYHAELQATYKEYDDGDAIAESHFDQFVFNCLIKTSTVITANNDTRTLYIYRANICLTVAILFSFLAAIPFYIGSVLN
jgi:hypothetical protein